MTTPSMMRRIRTRGLNCPNLFTQLNQAMSYVTIYEKIKWLESEINIVTTPSDVLRYCCKSVQMAPVTVELLLFFLCGSVICSCYSCCLSGRVLELGLVCLYIGDKGRAFRNGICQRKKDAPRYSGHRLFFTLWSRSSSCYFCPYLITDGVSCL
jgi:hypothetical protein